jgi:hypothetical protein
VAVQQAFRVWRAPRMLRGVSPFLAHHVIVALQQSAWRAKKHVRFNCPE